MMSNEALPKAEGLHYLWHLHGIGLLEEVERGKNSDKQTVFLPHQLWKPKEPLERVSRVAIIDNGCVRRHPNLAAGRIRFPIEFSRSMVGTVYRDPREPGDTGPDPDLALEKDRILAALAGCGLGDLAVKAEEEDDNRNKPSLALREAIRAVCEGNWPAFDIETTVQSPAERFSPHGTACAGLVGADAEVEETGDGQPANPWAIDYSGVNPLAEIIPITTVYNQDYWPIIMALLYAVVREADVILIPRAIEEMAAPEEDPDTSDPRHSRLLTDDTRYADFRLLRHVLRAVSDAIPVVVPAGNNGAGGIEFPAKFSNGEFPSLIVCGAVNNNGVRSAYSSTGANDIIHAPSDDSQELTRDDTRYDEFSWRARRLSMLPAQDGAIGNRYGAYGILAIDVPGFYGYTVEGNNPIDYGEQRNPAELDEQFDRADLRPRSLYAIFGGTSAASSIVAGVCSLVQKRARAKLGGAAMKRLLIDASQEKMEPQIEVPILTARKRTAAAPGGHDPEADRPGVLNAVTALELLEKSQGEQP
jgi:subtilisin family serine protease